MSILIGIIINDEAIIASDTRLCNYLDNYRLVKDGFRKIFIFTIDDDEFIIGCGGDVCHLCKFQTAINETEFPDEFGFDYFTSKCKELLVEHKLNKLNLLIAGLEKGIPKISRVNLTGDITTIGDGEYLVLWPGSLPENLVHLVNVLFASYQPMPSVEDKRNGIIDHLHYVITKVSELDQGKSVNTDIHYACLSSKELFCSPKSHHGYDML